MRQIYVCLGCAGQYLPPETMNYPTLGIDVSPVHCSRPECTTSVEDSMNVIAVPEDVVAKWARRAAGLARGRRAQASPGPGRSKLL
ncbi:hypothetical protein [Streptomyces sp. NPDC087300]|uniref:hypothetical protein n=1 Tax=Streptomyces sp. NPDC087300 TaxID=3365780 RepID=UPI00380D2188